MKHFSNLMQRLELFQNINWALKQVRVPFCRTDVLHYCNRLLICLNSKFDELKKIR